MIANRNAAVAAVFLCTISGVAAPAQEAGYRHVGSNELLDGYVKHGERIETVAHVWSAQEGEFLNFNRASARLPFRLDLSGADAAQVARLRSQCQAKTQFHGGCEVTLRGVAARAENKRILVVNQIVEIGPAR